LGSVTYLQTEETLTKTFSHLGKGWVTFIVTIIVISAEKKVSDPTSSNLIAMFITE